MFCLLLDASWDTAKRWTTYVFSIFAYLRLTVTQLLFWWDTQPALCSALSFKRRCSAIQIVLVSTKAILCLLCVDFRIGFIALSLLPPTFLFASKSSFLAILLGPTGSSLTPAAASFSYTKVNFIHKWSGRLLLLAALLHGSIWINNHIVYDIQILGAQKETSGVAALAVLCVIALSSLHPIRKWYYGVFHLIQCVFF